MIWIAAYRGFLTFTVHGSEWQRMAVAGDALCRFKASALSDPWDEAR